MIKKKIIIFLFLLSSCGYQPIFVDSKSNKLIFKEIELTGEKNINRKIISISGLKEDSQNFTYSKLKIDSKKRIIETSKNAKGQANSFKTTVEINLTIEDVNNKNEQVNGKEFWLVASKGGAAGAYSSEAGMKQLTRKIKTLLPNLEIN